MQLATARPEEIEALRRAAEDVGSKVLAEDCFTVDHEGRWPERGLRALAQAGLLALHVPERLGGHG